MESRSELKSFRQEDERKNETQRLTKNTAASEESKEIPDMESGLEPEESLFSDFSENQGDTSDLIRIYKENTLEVSLKYPSGWMYKDQNVEDMLDGITFLTTTAGYITALCSHRSSRKKYLESPKVSAQL